MNRYTGTFFSIFLSKPTGSEMRRPLLRPRTPLQERLGLAQAAEAPGFLKAEGYYPTGGRLALASPFPPPPLLRLCPPGLLPLPCCLVLLSPAYPWEVPWLDLGRSRPKAWEFVKAASQACGLSGAGSWASASACRWMGLSGAFGVFSCSYWDMLWPCQNWGLRMKEWGPLDEQSQVLSSPALLQLGLSSSQCPGHSGSPLSLAHPLWLPVSLWGFLGLQ